MDILVVGATGATGRLLVRQLLDHGHRVRAIVRSPERFREDVPDHDRLSVIHASVLDLSDDEMRHHVDGCSAVASCLGHNMTFRGIFGPPRKLVTDATRGLCHAIKANSIPAGASDTPTRFVLMNTAGNANRDLDEPVSFGQKCVIALLRLLLPPHPDNEKAADYLRTRIGPDDDQVEWVAVRPDGLVDHAEVSEYEVHQSPTRSAIFDPGETSRINVAHFMAELITDEVTWNRWKGRMPVIYNRPSV